MFSQNLRYLRKKEGISQASLSQVVGCSRSSLGDYETGRIEPNLAMLIKLADFFSVSIDKLIREDLETLDKQAIAYRSLGSIQSKKLRVLSTTVDAAGRENVEIVPNKAKAGYLTGYADPEFIAELPKMHIPGLPQGTHRGFELEGDSMPPISHGALVIARYVEHASELKDDKDYVIVSRDGMAFKKIRKLKNSLQMISYNPVYQPFEVAFEDILEAWHYYAYFDKTPISYKLTLDEIHQNILSLNGKVDKLLLK